MDESRLISAADQPEEARVEASLRPARLDEYVGQPAMKERLGIYLESARNRRRGARPRADLRPARPGQDHPGQCDRRRNGHPAAPDLRPGARAAGDLAAMLTNLEPGDVLFVDEIHRLSPVVEEVLYPAMEDYRIDIIIGEGPAARSIQLDLPRFTLVGATTRAGLLTSPLRDRFGIVERLEFYDVDDLAKHRRAFGRHSRHRRRCARRGRDRAPLARHAADRQSSAAPRAGLCRGARRGPDRRPGSRRCAGDDAGRRRGLRPARPAPAQMLVEHFNGGPVGVESLAAALSEERGTIEDVIEPYLIQQGYLIRTARGRMATDSDLAHLGLKPPSGQGAPVGICSAQFRSGMIR
jgi:Holliday junction DNA helicase RuvB